MCGIGWKSLEVNIAGSGPQPMMDGVGSKTSQIPHLSGRITLRGDL